MTSLSDQIEMLRKHHSLQFLSFGMCLLIFGCGSRGPTGEVVPTVSASGVLTLRGKPLEYYRVMLFPEKGDRPAMGITDAEGRFTLGTNRSDDGAVVGRHHVAVQYIGPPNTNPGAGITDFTSPPSPKSNIDKKYHDPATSDLQVEIKKGGNAEIALDLK